MKRIEKPTRGADETKTSNDGMYRPVILKYKCFGGVHFQQPPDSSKSTTKQQNDDLAATAPTCHGIETELERMYEFEPMSAKKAVFNFAQYTSTTVAGSADAWESRRHRMEKGLHGDLFSTKKHETIEDHSNQDIRKLFPLIIDHRAIDYDSGDEDKDNHRSSNTLDRLREAARQNVEMLNDGRTLSPSKHEPTLWTTASFYGKTDIAILVLFPYLNPYKKEALSKGDGTSHVGSSSKSADKIESSATLAALAPELKFGLAVREAGDKKYPGVVDELNTARIGPIEISIGSRIEESDEDTVETDESDSYEKHHYNENSLSPQDKDTSRRKGIKLDGISQSISDAAQKTASRMVTNLDLIRNELSDDFIGRTISSGERVMEGCGKSLERMQKVMSDMYENWINSDNSKKR